MSYQLPTKPSHFGIWIGDFISYSMDLVGFSDFAHVLHILSKSGIRSLHPEEIKWVKEVFGHTIDPRQVWVDDNSCWWLHKMAYAWVFYNTINYKNEISIPVFCHELVHIWQYQNFGSMYIMRALLAQRSKQGYNYGNIEGLYQRLVRGDSLIDLNFEQQGAVIEDYVKAKYKNAPLSQFEFSVYYSFVKDLELS